MEATTASLSLHQLRELYIAHAKGYYRRGDGHPTDEHLNIRTAIDRFIAFVGDGALGAKLNKHQLRAWMDQLAAEGKSRIYINQLLGKVRRWVEWCEGRGYIPVGVYAELMTLMPLRKNRSKAKEPKRHMAVSLDDVLSVSDRLYPLARDVLRLLKLTGARPSELLELTNAEIIIDDHGARIVPQQHKSAHHGHARIIPLSREALFIIGRWWKPLAPADRIFPSIRKSGRGHYTIDGFRAALKRACKAAGVEPFTPYQVRRAVARHVRKHRGLDAAQALLGHASARTTEIYAPLTSDQAEALEAARRATEVL